MDDTSRDNACFSTANRPVTAKPSTSPDGDRKRAFTSEPACSMPHAPAAPAGGWHTAVGQQGVLIITGMAPELTSVRSPVRVFARARAQAINGNTYSNTWPSTSAQAPDVYALGDCAEVDGQVLLYVLPLMACARALAKTLTGERTEVSRSEERRVGKRGSAR